MFSTQVELDSDLRCHRNIRGLEEFLNKANRSLLWYLVSINDISAWFYTVDFLLLTWELFRPCLVLVRCPAWKKKRKTSFANVFTQIQIFAPWQSHLPIQKHCVNPALIVLMSSFRFYFTNLAYNALVREIDKDRTGANIKKMKTNMKNYYIINYITR